MATPWDRITEDDYRSWLINRQVTFDEFNEASLVDRITFRTLFEQQQQFSRPQFLDEETQKGLAAMAHDHVNKKKTIILSQATNTVKNELLGMLDLPEKGATWKNKPAGLSRVDGFKWLGVGEDTDENRCAYIKYLNHLLAIPETYTLADVQQNRGLLDVEFLRGNEDSRRFRGTTDVAIVKSQESENETIRNNIETLLELKKPENLGMKNHTPQVVCEHFAASYLNQRHPIVSVLTDLNNSWTFYWFATAEDSSGVALHKLCLKDKTATTEAKYILDSLYKESSGEALPTTLLNRLSWEAVINAISKNNNKRLRRDRGDDDDGVSCWTNHDSKPSGPRLGDQYRKSGGGSRPSGSGGTTHPHNQGGANGDASMSMASALSLFAPPSARDVANELDLLDMVDENEKFEIVRSFAMQHIVPYMEGDINC